MTFHEIIDTRGHLLYWLPDKEYIRDTNKILGMDLDWTIIKPIRGKIHPIDENDWELFQPDLSKIKTKIDDGYKFVIFTNQAGLLKQRKDTMDLPGFKTRWNNIYEKFKHSGIFSVYLIVSMYDDFNRKPCTGMWEFVETHLNNDIKVDRNKSLFIGDMAGRKRDFTNTDLTFAINLGCNFQTPEVFYNNDKSAGNNTQKLIEKLNTDKTIFNGKKFLQDFDKIITQNNKIIKDKIIDLMKKEQCLVIFIGSPASGKSSFYNLYLKAHAKYLSNDTFNGTPGKFNKEIEKLLSQGHNVVIDNTNSTMKIREKYISIAEKACKDRKIFILGVHFTTPKEICLHLNELRNKKNNICRLNGNDMCRENVPTVAIHAYWKRFEIPNKQNEKFSELFSLEYEPVFAIENGITKDEFTMFL